MTKLACTRCELTTNISGTFGLCHCGGLLFKTFTITKELLFSSDYINVVRLNGWFIATEPAKSQDNKAVAVLPYRYKNGRPQYLSRFELNPAHMTDDNHQVSIITGACETGEPLHHAKMELLEEAGYDIPEKRFNFHGIVNPQKDSCTRLYLYSVEILDKDTRGYYSGDGTDNETKEFAEWVSYKAMLNAKDPYIHTIMLRM